ncbi:Helix-turn-helix [Anaerovirgula multivorans]|uniref:Helix-turn-helix n=1 Tax=Anaerovirgula multivorans TaxID=312168 RepID=A0A239AN27_9FIRM|nr:helix-turn-helix transcriptional regulator [Anaerovirgula multivorans]SNR96363.1 Helix-turn-helix [Anaerovirgula multivorans]
MSLGEFIRSTREKKDMSQRQLSLYSGVSNTEISKIESGERKKPSPDTLKKISGPLGVAYAKLMEEAGYLDDIVKEESSQYRTREQNKYKMTKEERIEYLKNALIKNNIIKEDDVVDEDTIEYLMDIFKATLKRYRDK